MRGAAGGDAIEIVIGVCAARATAANVRAPPIEASSRDTRRSFDIGRLLVGRSGFDTAGGSGGQELTRTTTSDRRITCRIRRRRYLFGEHSGSPAWQRRSP